MPEKKTVYGMYLLLKMNVEKIFMINSICLIAENNRKLREQRAMTQKELTELVGISQSHLSKMELLERFLYIEMIKVFHRYVGIYEG